MLPEHSLSSGSRDSPEGHPTQPMVRQPVRPCLRVCEIIEVRCHWAESRQAMASMWPQPTGVQTSELRFKDNTRGQGLLVKGPVSILKSMLFFVACAHENLILHCP